MIVRFVDLKTPGLKIPLSLIATLAVVFLAATWSSSTSDLADAESGPATASGPASELDPFYGVVSQKTMRDADYDSMTWGRMGFYRMPVPWTSIEHSGDGDYDFSSLDSVVEKTADRGIKLMPTIYDSPAWLDFNRRKLPVWSGYAIGKWKDMLTAVVSRYGTDGEFWDENPDVTYQPVLDWQIWNEPNIKYFASPVSPTRYARLMKISSAAIKAVDPDARVVLGGLYGTPPPGTGIDAAPFLKRLYKVKGFRKSYDVAAIHPYAATTRESLSRVFPVRGVMNRNGNKRRPMYITELGWGSDASTKFGKGSQVAQASQVRSAYKQLLKYRARLRLKAVIWFSWSDLPDTTRSCAFCYQTGFFDNDGNAKPSWWALLNFTHGI